MLRPNVGHVVEIRQGRMPKSLFFSLKKIRKRNRISECESRGRIPKSIQGRCLHYFANK